MRKISPALLKTLLKPRPKAAHKNRFGHVLVLAGSRGMTGAALLCAEGALRGGAGLVTLGLPKSQQRVAARRGRREFMTLPLPEGLRGTFCGGALKTVLTFCQTRGITSLAVGPGMGLNRDTAEFVRGLLKKSPRPVVLDADGINVLARFGWPLQRKAQVMVTPHSGEMGRLLGRSRIWIQNHRPDAVTLLAQQKRVVVVLKGHKTLVGTDQELYQNPTGNPGMATGGTGDILCGLAAALVGQVEGKTPQQKLFHSALAGVYVHGLAGDLAVRKKTRLALVAGDLFEFFPRALRLTFGKKI